MHGKSEGSAGGLFLAGWPAPVPSSTQPADTSRAPRRAAQSVSALADISALELRIFSDPVILSATVAGMCKRVCMMRSLEETGGDDLERLRRGIEYLERGVVQYADLLISLAIREQTA